MKKYLLLLFVVICSCSYGQFQATVSTQLNQMVFDTIYSPDSVAFNSVSFSDNYFTNEEGKPRVPIKYVRYVLPENVGITGINVTSGNSTIINESYYLYPAQKEVPMYIDPVFSEPDRDAYSSNSPYPGIFAEIVGDCYYQGYHVVTVRVCPVQYTPGELTLEYYPNITISISYNTISFTNTGAQSLRRFNVIKSIIQSMVANPDDVNNYNGGVAQVVDNGNPEENKSMPLYTGPVPDYIIITSRDADNGGLNTQFERLAEWKKKKGIPVLMAYTEEIAGNYQGVDLQEKIRNYLKEMRLMWGSGLYVLLGGDINIIPARKGTKDNGIHITDMYYSDVWKASITNYNWNPNGDDKFGYTTSSDGETGIDLSADNIIGRAPVENAIEAQIFVDKVIGYEHLTNVTSHDYVNNVLLIGAHQFNYNDFTGQMYGTSIYNMFLPTIIKNHTWRIFDDYTTSTSYPGDEELTNVGVINNLNNNGNAPYGYQHIITHYDHGNPYTIGTSDRRKGQVITGLDMSSLTNLNYYQIMLTLACQPNDFSKDCFGEDYMNNPNGGAVAFIGNTGFGHTDLYEGYSFFKSVYNYNNLSPYGYTLGNAFSAARDAQTGFARKHLTLLGDPEMPIWTTTPSTMSLVSQSFSNNQVNVTVSGLTTGVMVTICIWKENEVFAFETIEATGSQVSAVFNNVNPNTNGDIKVTATAHNYLPLESTISVSITDKHLYAVAQIFNDDNISPSIGNNDGKPDAGETIELYVTLRNSGTVQAQNVQATLTCESTNCSNYIPSITGTATFPSISGGQSQIANSPFLFTIDESTPSMQHLKYKLSITADGGYTATDEFYFDVYSPEIFDMNKYIVTTTDGDKIPEANETVYFNIQLGNNGNAVATNINTSLSTTDPDIQSYDNSQHSYPLINEYDNEVASSNFSCIISPTYSGGALDFNINTTNQFGKSWTASFNLVQYPNPLTVSNINSVGGENYIYLNWDPYNISTISGYNIYRSPADGNGNDLDDYVMLNLLPLTASCYTDMGLSLETFYYYKVVAISLDGIEALLPAEGHQANTSLVVHTGWPISTSINAGHQYGPNLTYDVDNNGDEEIFFPKSGFNEYAYLMGFSHYGNEIFDRDNTNTTVTGIVYLDSPPTDLWDIPALMDIDNDGYTEAIMATGYSSANGRLVSYKMYDNNSDGSPDEVFNNSISNHNYRCPVVTDINNDNYGEIAVASAWGTLSVYDKTGTQLWLSDGLPGGYGRLCVADIDGLSGGDVQKEIIAGENDGIYVWNHDGSVYGTNYKVWPSTSNPNRHYDCSPIVADIDGITGKEMVVMSYNTTSKIAYVNIIDHDGNFITNWDGDSHSIQLKSNAFMMPEMSVGDMNHDGLIEIVAIGHEVIKIWEPNGSLLREINVTGFEAGGDGAGVLTPILADVDNDDTNSEVVVASKESGLLYAFKLNGDMAKGFPVKTLDYGITQDPAISDIDEDGLNEIVIGLENTGYVWDTHGEAINNVWPYVRFNTQNTGEYTNCYFDNTTLTINNTIDWNFNRKLYKNLTIANNSTLTLGAQLILPDEATITVESGSTLIVDDGGVIKGSCSQYFGGNIIVESEGTLILNTNSTIELGGDGKILIDQSGEHFRGYMEFYPDANIVLADENTMIDLKGYLNINDNANFTFTGNGFLRISGNGLNPAGISAGDYASITLDGTSKTDKILEIDQADLEVPYNLEAFTLSDGWVNMKYSTARLLAYGPNTNITISNVKFNPLNGTTRTTHRGLWVYGQSSCNITDSDFEYGQYGIYGYLTGESPLENIWNCTFINNWAGIWIHGEAVQASFCTFTKNDYGFYAENTSLNSNLLDNCTFSASPNGNKAPIRYVNCTGDLLVNHSTINYADQSSVYAVNSTGTFNFNIRCSSVNCTAGYVLNFANGAILNMSPNSFSTGNNVITGVSPLRFTLANSFNIDNGHNSISKTGGYHIYGTLTGPACSSTINSRYNAWNPSTPTNYVTRSGCNPAQYTVLCTPTGSFVACQDNKLEQLAQITPEISNTTYLTALLAFQNAETSNDYITPFGLFKQILSEPIPAPTEQNIKLWENSWENMRNCFIQLYTNGQRKGSNNIELVEIIDAVDKMTQLQSNNYYRRFQLELEKATLYRLASDYDKSISLLTILVNDTSIINRSQAESWLCVVQLEKQVVEGTLEKNKIEEAQKECPAWKEEEIVSDIFGIENQNVSTNNFCWLNVVPNPSSTESILFVNTVRQELCDVEITDLFGRLIKTIKVEGGYSENVISFTEFTEGIYIVSLKENGQIVAKTMVAITK